MNDRDKLKEMDHLYTVCIQRAVVAWHRAGIGIESDAGAIAVIATTLFIKASKRKLKDVEERWHDPGCPLDFDDHDGDG